MTCSNKTSDVIRSVFFADFETTTKNILKPYLCCWIRADGEKKGSSYGDDCAKDLLEVLEHKSLTYFHNLSFDINFIVKHLTCVYDNPIIKSNRVMMIKGLYKRKLLTFKDSLSMIPDKLSEFPKLFKHRRSIEINKQSSKVH
jgi:hypothetical protein